VIVVTSKVDDFDNGGNDDTSVKSPILLVEENVITTSLVFSSFSFLDTIVHEVALSSSSSIAVATAASDAMTNLVCSQRSWFAGSRRFVIED